MKDCQFGVSSVNYSDSDSEGGDCNFPYIISRILNFGPVVVFWKVVELVFMGRCDENDGEWRWII